jgi:hypothetical protein
MSSNANFRTTLISSIALSVVATTGVSAATMPHRAFGAENEIMNIADEK